MIPLDPAHVVGTGGALGAVLRHYVSEMVETREFPLGTFTVNVLGSFLLALLSFGAIGGQLGLLLGTGVAGSFTTFSSFSYETVRLWETGERAKAFVNAIGTFVAALVAIALARGLVSLLG